MELLKLNQYSMVKKHKEFSFFIKSNLHHACFLILIVLGSLKRLELKSKNHNEFEKSV